MYKVHYLNTVEANDLHGRTFDLRVTLDKTPPEELDKPVNRSDVYQQISNRRYIFSFYCHV